MFNKQHHIESISKGYQPKGDYIEFYDTKNELKSFGIGEALATAFDEKGRSTPLAATMLRAPMSRMDLLSKSELKDLIDPSCLEIKHNKTIDREGAYEILKPKIQRANVEKAQEKAREERKKLEKNTTGRRRNTSAGPQKKAIVEVLTSATLIVRNGSFK